MSESLATPEPDLLDIDGERIATWRLGRTDEAAPPLVLCHGTPWSAAVWMPVAQRLASQYRLYLWDMPGYGRSIAESGTGEAEPGAVPPAVDLVAQRRRFAALLDHWGLDRPHVLAHDIGGAVALGAHLLEDREFASLLLLDVVTLDPWGSSFFRVVAQNESVFSAIPPALHAALVREYIRGAGGTGLDPAHVEALATPWLSEAGGPAFYRQIAALDPAHTVPIVERLGAVRCPVRVFWGEDDPWIPVDQASALARRLPGDPQVVTFPGAGHLVPLEATEAFVARFREWFRDLVV
ncbi:alpha/beta fold hydrolase [Brevibacterium litoralis]|uniref:alpha/beta fold hydrolase n=1 Tax=Brevibacterium litoralis TaxID=3138935 RepID=UPI0032EF9E36